MLRAVSEADVRGLVLKAKDGDIDATKLLFGFIGKGPETAVTAVPNQTHEQRRASLLNLAARIRGDKSEAAGAAQPWRKTG